MLAQYISDTECDAEEECVGEKSDRERLAPQRPALKFVPAILPVGYEKGYERSEETERSADDEKEGKQHMQSVPLSNRDYIADSFWKCQ